MKMHVDLCNCVKRSLIVLRRFGHLQQCTVITVFRRAGRLHGCAGKIVFRCFEHLFYGRGVIIVSGRFGPCKLLHEKTK